MSENNKNNTNDINKSNIFVSDILLIIGIILYLVSFIPLKTNYSLDLTIRLSIYILDVNSDFHWIKIFV